MAIILLVCIVVAAASAAPPNDVVFRDWQQELFGRTELHKLQEGYPAKRSNYGSLYVSPCAAAASAAASAPAYAAPIPAYAPPTTSYYGHAPYHPIPSVPVHHGYAPSPYSHHYYRMEDEPENDQEIMGFSDMDQGTFDHVPMARSSYGPAPIVNAGQVSSGPVVGVFSNANTGGCSVPLLVSCSPSISHGRIAKSQPYYNNYNAYRDVEDQVHQEVEEHQEKAAHMSSEHSPQNSKPIGDQHQ